MTNDHPHVYCKIIVNGLRQPMPYLLKNVKLLFLNYKRINLPIENIHAEL